MPTRVSESVPALVRASQAVSGGATMSAPPPPPTLPLGRSRRPGSRRPGSRSPGPGQPDSLPPPSTGSGPSISFEPLALGAFFMLFLAPPIAFLMAIASVRRAAKTKVPPMLSWIAVLVTGFATLWSLGFIAALIESFS